MKVYALIPVFNRLEHTREILSCLRRQSGVDLQVVMVDDGSTDGTAQYLAEQPDLLVLKGNGQLWWAGSIQLALKAIRPKLQSGDFFLFMNNDTRIDDDYVAALVTSSLANGRAVVGSIVRSSAPPHELLDIGPKADLWNMAVWDVARDLPPQERECLAELYPVDFLPGRGTLYPAEVIDRIGYMRPLLLPHYHADYEFSDRARRAGFRLLVTTSAVIYSTAEFGNQRKAPSWRQRKFGKGSPENSLQKIAFFCMVGSLSQRLSAPLRMALAEVDRKLHPGRMFLLRACRRMVRIAPAALRTPMERLGILATASRTSRARARLLLALERRSFRRMEAMQAYTAITLVKGETRRVQVFGEAAPDHERFLRNIRVAVEPMRLDGSQSPQVDLAFCAWRGSAHGPLPEPGDLARLPRVGGVLYCLAYDAEDSGRVESLFADLTGAAGLEVLANGIVGHLQPGCASTSMPTDFFKNKGSWGARDMPPRFFVARRHSGT